MMVFSGHQNLTSAMKLRPEKRLYTSNLMLYTGKSHREFPEVGLVEKLTGSLYSWAELCMPTLH